MACFFDILRRHPADGCCFYGSLLLTVPRTVRHLGLCTIRCCCCCCCCCCFVVAGFSIVLFRRCKAKVGLGGRDNVLRRGLHVGQAQHFESPFCLANPPEFHHKREHRNGGNKKTSSHEIQNSDEDQQWIEGRTAEVLLSNAQG